MSAVVVRRFVGVCKPCARYSIRRHPDGAIQVYHDNPYEGINHPYEFDDEPISGLFADVETAEAELFRNPQFQASDLKLTDSRCWARQAPACSKLCEFDRCFPLRFEPDEAVFVVLELGGHGVHDTRQALDIIDEDKRLAERLDCFTQGAHAKDIAEAASRMAWISASVA
jgi:hypothetical protein